MIQKTKHILFVLWFVCLSSNAAELSLTAKSVLVVDADTSDILYQKNNDDVRPIASVTKLMTALVILDADLPLEEVIKITSDDVELTKVKGRATSKSLPIGTELTRRDMLHVMLMNSQNRAAVALARTYPGGVNMFVEKMNEKALELSMKNTHYTDPSGLHSDNVSTAADLALLIQTASQYPLVRDFSTTRSFNIKITKKHEHIFATTNRLVTTSNWNIILQKTGFINEAGRCMVMMTNIGVRRIIVVLLNSKSRQERSLDAARIKYWIENGVAPNKHELSLLDPYKNAKRKKRPTKRKTT